MSHAEQRVHMAMHGGKLWCNEHARFASGSYLEEKDVVCILHGASNPVALRRIDAEDTFERYLSCQRDDNVSLGGGALNPHDF
jgi:hypothetical protein